MPVAAHYPAAEADASCAAPVTVTVTETAGHIPVAPTSMVPYYPTAVSSLVPEASTVGTIGTIAPTGTGAVTSPPVPQFTGAASGLKVGGALAGVGAVAAFLL
ncbi:hydrolase [Pyrenophora seminiperda CCB06]|uniref:Hydrolase n=1 Tax=Pyrenophora seminiperda CCB06 TaxID=1302712 RepID=A0A3M7MIM8_9PLEO|nr:hydrolase [Pyrenophora seminiperda CCB06]